MAKFIQNTGKLIAFALIAGIFVLIFGIYWQLTHGESADYNEVKQAIVEYGNDLNEMRQYLYLPARDYNFFQANLTEAQNNQKTPQEDNQYQKGVQLFAETLAKNTALVQKQNEGKDTLQSLLKDSDFVQKLRELELRLDKEIQTDDQFARLKLISEGEPLAQLLLDLEHKTYSLQSIRGVEPITTKKVEEDRAKEEILSYLKENKTPILEQRTLLEEQKRDLKNLLQAEDIKEIATQNRLALSIDPVETPTTFDYYVADLNGAPLLSFSIDRKTGNYRMENQAYTTATDLKAPLLQKLKTLSGETTQVKAIKQKKVSLENYLFGPEFKAQMAPAGLEVKTGRIEEGKVFYDLFQTSNQNTMGSIVFEEGTGEIRFIDGANGQESSLEDILSGSKKKP